MNKNTTPAILMAKAFAILSFVKSCDISDEHRVMLMDMVDSFVSHALSELVSATGANAQKVKDEGLRLFRDMSTQAQSLQETKH